jgi:hypothetical protein
MLNSAQQNGEKKAKATFAECIAEVNVSDRFLKRLKNTPIVLRQEAIERTLLQSPKRLA